ncbi:MAG: SDR family NAD(P)-dependent oxidoreductase [Fimbriimonadaceae bacterium]|nr:SDR family NAD(P)-dependent oxidoreductase [Fimbriimonadaceae bacterium]
MLETWALDVLVGGAPGIDDTAVVIAAGRAQAVGVLDLAGHTVVSATACLARLRAQATRWGVRRCAWSGPGLAALDLSGASLVLLAGDDPAALPAELDAARRIAALVLVEATSAAAVVAAPGAAGFVARGHECGGLGGDEAGFILLQRLLTLTEQPIWAAGVGLHSAAGAVAAGARGVLLDRQVGLCRESALPAAVRDVLLRADGGETTVLGAELGWPVRCYDRPGWQAVDELRRQAAELGAAGGSRADWLRAVAARVGWRPSEDLWLLGQEAGLAAPLAAVQQTVGGVVTACRAQVRESLRLARELQPLAAGAPLAQSHGTEFPIVQGPMTRVSDNAEFAAAVAAGGALPFLALALLPEQPARELLAATKAAVGERPWGVGILGFVPPELREVQLAAVRAAAPQVALIAGGRPTQAKELEAAGIPTYLHVPSPRLLERFLADGASRFIFEGRECGGHIGPRTSFVLWDQAVTTLLAALGDQPAERLHLLFAGGLHDARSAAAVAALAAPLAARGAKIGVQLGTAYLFTAEAVATGAVTVGFQQEAASCDQTAVLETSPGHAIRGAPTPAVGEFRARRRELEAAGQSPREVAAALERLNLGRLRIASKGLVRNPAQASDPAAPRYLELDAAAQRQQGLYMVGQLAALRGAVVPLRAVHQAIAAAGSVLPAEPPAVPVVVDPRRTAVAIVGMAALLPGADGVQRYWENVLARHDAVTEVPTERWDPAVFFDPEARRGGDHTYSKWGGFLDPHPFDPLRYGIPPRSLPTIEPVHLLALEVVRAALSDAGYAERPFARERTAVVFGAGGGSSDLSNAFGFRGMLRYWLNRRPGLPDADELLQALNEDLPQWCEDTFPGVLINVIAGRVANRFNFGGANFTVDAACASSLAAVDAAAKELQLGRCDVAIAGGADTTQDIFSYLLFSNSMVLSPRGRCRTFDESADGIAIAEGVAAVVLKRVEDAERDGDRIYAVIRGIAASSDGRALGLTAPNLDGQMRAVAAAYQRAEVSPATVELVEAHGTGTAVGDRTEVEALSRVYEAAGAAVGQVAIGSVKSNIGHTKCTAGLASLIKTARALHDQVLPPTIHVEKVNGKAGFGRNPFYPIREARPWLNRIHEHPRRAGVSAFGFGGTNFHCVLEEYPANLAPAPRSLHARSSELLVWQAASVAALREQIAALRGHCEQPLPHLRLRDLARSLTAARGTGPVRLALVVARVADLPRQLDAALAALDGQPPAAGVYYTPQPLLTAGGLAFLVPGQGSQRVLMLAELAIHFPTVARVLEDADVALLEQFPQGLSRRIYPPSSYTPAEQAAAEAALQATNVAQPALGACDTALLALLREFGLQPDMVAGHSYGEYVALYAAGCLSFDDLLRLSQARGQAVVDTAGPAAGAMAAVLADAATTATAVAAVAGLTLANLNSPLQTVIAGSEEALTAGLAACAAAGLKAKRLPVAAAFHTALMQPAADRLAAALTATPFAAPRLPVYSNTTAAPYEGDPRPALRQHLTSPVRFVEQIEAIWQAGARAFVEVGPGRVLTGLVGRILDGRPHLALPSDGSQGVDAWHQLLAALWAHGAEPRLELLYEGRDAALLDLSDLAAASAPAALPPSTWMVSGGRSVPLVAPPKPSPVAAAPRPAAPPAAPVPPAPLAAPAAARSALLPLSMAASGDPVLDQVQAAMRQALEQQQRFVQETLAQQQRLLEEYLQAQQAVLTAYLGGQPVAPPPTVDGAAAMPAAVPAPAAAAAEEPPAVAAEAPAASGPLDLTATLLRLVADRTGYPPEMLDLNVDLEADLGIDSIKRIEILGGLQDSLPGEVAVRIESGLEDLAQQKTLAQVIAWMEAQMATPADPPVPPPAPAAVPDEAARAAAAAVCRHVLRAVPTPLRGTPRELTEGQVVLLAGEPQCREALAERLLAARQVPRLVTLPADREEAQAALASARTAGPVGGLAWLSDPQDEPTAATVRGLFLLAQAAAADLSSAAHDGFGLLAATAMGGDNGLTAAARPGDGAVGGLVKALAKELPAVVVKVVDLPPGEPRELAAALWQEQLAGDPLVEVGLGPVRTAVHCVPLPADGAGLTLAAPQVVLLTGGARGITAEVADGLAARGVTVVLVGRTPRPTPLESPATREINDQAVLKRALGDQLRAQGEAAVPAKIEAAYRNLQREREVRATLDRLRASGATVAYEACDVTSGAEFAALLERVRATHGRLDGVIAGAGVIHDKRLADKTLEQFAAVWEAKVVAAAHLLAALPPEGLPFLCFFTSVAGRFGNLGQTDYAAANEYLSKLARRLQGQWPGRVVATAWGPWDDVGMVHPELRRRMRDRGVVLVPPDRGLALLLDELTHGAGEPEVVLAALGAGTAL